MVTETAHVMFSAVGPVGYFTVGAEEEGETAFVCPALYMVLQCRADQDMIQIAPYTTEVIGAHLSAQFVFILLDNTDKAGARLGEYPVTWFCIEIAQNYYIGVAVTGNGIYYFQYCTNGQFAVLF